MLINELHSPGIRALLDYDNTIFDTLALPDGVALDDVVNHILYTYGDTPLYVPEPDVLKYYHAKWSARRLPVWNKYKALLEAEYNPLENYDRSEETERKNTGTLTNAATGNDTNRRSGSETNAASGSDTFTPTGTETNTESRSAFNSASWESDNKNELSFTNRQDQTTYGRTDTRTYNNVSDSVTYGRTDTRTDNLTEKTTSRIHGNIGVTTSQQMFLAEVGIIPYYDFIDYIAKDWHQEFCLGLYY